LGTAMIMYADDYNQYLPGCWWYNELRNNGYVKQRSKYKGIFRCPTFNWRTTKWGRGGAHSSDWRTYGIFFYRWFPYSFNECLSKRAFLEYYPSFAETYPIEKLTQVKSSYSKVILLCDSACEWNEWHEQLCQFWRGDAWSTGRWRGRHNGWTGKNWLLLDCHVEWQTPEDARDKFILK